MPDCSNVHDRLRRWAEKIISTCSDFGSTGKMRLHECTISGNTERDDSLPCVHSCHHVRRQISAGCTNPALPAPLEPGGNGEPSLREADDETSSATAAH